jgi:DNA-binding SARP family transcriptional activator
MLGDSLPSRGGGMDRQVPVRKESDAAIYRSGGSVERVETSLSLLGGFQLVSAGESVELPRGAQRLLAFLALHLHPMQRSYVAGSLWPDGTEAHSSASLRSTLWRLRRPGIRIVNASSSHLCLADNLSVDVREVVQRVRRLVDRSLPCRPEDLDPMPLTGELLPDWSADDWMLIERERIRQLCLHGLEALCHRLLALGRHSEAVEAALSAVRGEPLRESAHRALITVHLAEGNHCEALRQYRWYAQILRNELGLEPSPRIMRLVTGLQRAV